MSKPETKLCPQCGTELAADAAFCPCCTATFTERKLMAMPRGRKRWQRYLMLLIGVAAIVTALIVSLTRQAPESDTAAPYELYYTGEDGREYHVFTCLTPEGDAKAVTPVGYRAELIAEGGDVDYPSTIVVQDAVTQDFAAEDFALLLDSWDVTVNADEGVGRVSLWEAEDEAKDSPALLYRRLSGDASCTHNEVVWTLRMKNGDTLTLTQIVEHVLQEERVYRYDETPMTTAAELQTLLDTIAAECTAETLVTVFLPQTTYDQPITVPCSVTLVGNGTVFTKPVTVTALEDTDLAFALVKFETCSFLGDGTGTGITAGAPTYFCGCNLSDWDVGAVANDGGWLYLHGGRIANNNVGVRYDSAFSSTYTYNIRDIAFERNTTALELVTFPKGVWTCLERCAFTGNTTDVANPNDYRVETVA